MAMRWMPKTRVAPTPVSATDSDTWPLAGTRR